MQLFDCKNMRSQMDAQVLFIISELQRLLPSHLSISDPRLRTSRYASIPMFRYWVSVDQLVDLLKFVEIGQTETIFYQITYTS